MLRTMFMDSLISRSQPRTYIAWDRCTSEELVAHIKEKQRAFNTKDTYVYCRVYVGGKYQDSFDRVRHLYKDWIVYESPLFYNRVHPERNYPSNQLLIIEKPKRNKT